MTDLQRIIDALAAVRVATKAEEEAHERRCQAEIRLAELVGTARRDKDTGFGADLDARELIVKAAIDGRLIPLDEKEQSGIPDCADCGWSGVRLNGKCSRCNELRPAAE